MPLRWTIDPQERLVTTIAEGNVTRADFDVYIQAIHDADAHGYRKLFDGRHADTAMGAEEMMSLGVLFRGFHGKSPIGPLAVVLAEDKADLVSRTLGMLAAADRPMRVFREIGPARRWIESLAL